MRRFKLPVPWTSRGFLDAFYVFAIGLNLALLGADIARGWWIAAEVPIAAIAAAMLARLVLFTVRAKYETEREYWLTMREKGIAERDFAQGMLQQFQQAVKEGRVSIGGTMPIEDAEDDDDPGGSRH